MITKTVNGRAYNFRDYLSAGGARRLMQLLPDKDSPDNAAMIPYTSRLIYEMILDADGNKYQNEEAALDAIHCADDLAVVNLCYELTGMEAQSTDPLASQTDSATG